ncbi:MAG: hypothetical protein JW909_05890 [Planctomycetes bacterium]|nr:hypothetical protein [Planctomycetota bacterium]
MKGRFTIRPQPAEIKEPDLPGLKESAARLRSVPDQPADRPFLRQTAPDRNSWPQTWLALHGYDAKNMPPAGERRRGRQPGKHTPSCSMRVDIPSVGPVRLDVAIVLGGILRVSLASFSQTFVDELRRELAGLDDIAREMNLRLLLDLHVLEHEGTGHAIIG